MCMNLESISSLNREELEELALKRVCACLYYDLADTVGETPDADLIKVIRNEYECDMCDLPE